MTPLAPVLLYYSPPPCQHIFSTHFSNIPYHFTPSTHPINTPFSPCFINPPSAHTESPNTVTTLNQTHEQQLLRQQKAYEDVVTTNKTLEEKLKTNEEKLKTLEEKLKTLEEKLKENLADKGMLERELATTVATVVGLERAVEGYRISSQVVITSCQYPLSCQYLLLSQPINAPYQCTLSVRPLSKPYQHTFSIYHVNVPC